MIGLKSKRRGFTLGEVLIVSSIFAVMVIGIIFAINRAFLFMNNTRISVRAANFAREGVEMVYNIRDSNWRQQSGEKDKYRWSIGLRDNYGTLTGTKYNTGIYIIKEGTNSSGDSYVYADFLTGDTDIYTIEGFFSGDNSRWRNKSKLDFTGTYSYFSGGSLYTGGKLEDLLYADGLAFYRVLRVYGFSCKNTSCSLDKDPDPKEMRFCVKVFYELNGGKHQNELCSIMTNFME